MRLMHAATWQATQNRDWFYRVLHDEEDQPLGVEFQGRINTAIHTVLFTDNPQACRDWAGMGHEVFFEKYQKFFRTPTRGEIDMFLKGAEHVLRVGEQEQRGKSSYILDRQRREFSKMQFQYEDKIRKGQV